MLIRYARWTVARAQFRWQMWRAERAAWYQGTDILEMLTTAEMPVIERPPWRTAPERSGEHCPRCGGTTVDANGNVKVFGTRCRPWREGRDCKPDRSDEPTAYAAGRPLPRDGKHSTAVRIAHWARIDRLHQLRDRMGIAPAKVVALP